MEQYALGTLSGLVVGIAVGWFGHVLAGRRSKQDRKVSAETELLDRCSGVFAARIQYVLAYHRQTDGYTKIRDDYRHLQRQYHWADPEVVLKGTAEWDAYMVAERAALGMKTEVPAARVKLVTDASMPVLDLLAKRRAKTTK